MGTYFSSRSDCDDPYRRLALAVLAHAVSEARSQARNVTRQKRARQARAWLHSEDAAVWCDLLNIELPRGWNAIRDDDCYNGLW